MARKFFRHAESIDMEKLTQLPGSMHQLNHRCVQTWLKAEDSAIPFAQLMQQYEDSRHMARKLREDCKKVVNKGMFFHAISSQHTRLANLVHRMEMAERGQSETHKPFPEPLIPGNENIIYLADAEALFKEGLAMSHCVHGAAAHAAMGWSNFYKVLWPERATLEIAGVPGWARLEQMKLEYNREPAQATFDYIKQWIEEANTEYKTKRAKKHDETRTA